MSDVTKEFELQTDKLLAHNYPCRKCGLETKHQTVSRYTERGAQYYGGHHIDWAESNEIIQCLGCEEVSFRKCSTNSESLDYNYKTGQPYYVETVAFYPGRALGSKVIDHWLLPWSIGEVYKEARTAIENELFIIGGIAIRSLLESICSDVEAKGRNLAKKIDDLHARSLVTKEGVETLHKIRLLGNLSAHAAKRHTKDQLMLALEVVEHILIGTYIIPARAKDTFKGLDEVKKLLAPDDQ
ncbi:DUF4145 domain-containing protein [Pseudomonas sp. KU26590]|uniref:DUF4145 domain-containing protein n=1 Tax=Pseudomonas sp. KU26590 TaxID=2991051 RepID=UPI00223CEF3A|nr:DUF4145 domain-containing protein [Pseudomonas sp. KU26590]UZJ58247.1 DUF4145 domain-containing protein [Pseudomonas sp. KU26590]